MTEVTLFLDVDGVMSPFPGDSGPGWAQWKKVTCGFHCALSQDMADALAKLPVQIVWLTTWEEMANEVICPEVGWRELPVVERLRLPEDPWWKYAAVIDHAKTKGTPFIWVDDDLGDFLRGYPELIDALPEPHLLVCPDVEEGLTPALVGQIESWLEHHA